MILFPAHSDADAVDSLAHDRRWRAALLWTVRDLRNSRARRRILSLPNLCRLFDQRWHRAQPAPETASRGRDLGRAFLRHHYLAQQPFASRIAASAAAGNGHWCE